MKPEGERLATLEKWMEELDKKVDEGFKAILERLDGQDEKFASKLTEKIVYTMVAIILVAFIGSVVYFFIPKVSSTHYQSSQE